jgi:hypothetical protein
VQEAGRRALMPVDQRRGSSISWLRTPARELWSRRRMGEGDADSAPTRICGHGASEGTSDAAPARRTMSFGIERRAPWRVLEEHDELPRRTMSCPLSLGGAW